MSRGTYGKVTERRCLKVEAWPHEDRHRWLAALKPGDILDPCGSRSRYAEISNTKAAKGYGRWLSFLLTSRTSLEDSPEARITPTAVEAYVAEMRRLGNSTQTQMSRLQELYEMALVMDPRGNWEWIRRMQAKVRARHKPAREKRGRLVGTDDLLGLGLTLMADADGEPLSRQSAIAFRDGLICAFLALRPLRRKNLAALTLDQHILRIKGFWVIAIRDDETKTGDPIEEPWPAPLIAPLERYLAIYRPLLCKQTGYWSANIGKALWVSSHGSPFSQQAIYDRVVRVTREAFGKSLCPHLFRDSAATTLAVEDTEHVRMAAAILGHRTFATTEKYYIKANMVAAAHKYQQHVLNLRRQSDFEPDEE